MTAAGAPALETAMGPEGELAGLRLGLPSRRRQGFFRALLHHVVTVTRGEGLRRVWIGGVDGGAETAVVSSGFDAVLRLSAITVAGRRWIRATEATGADPDLVNSALTSLGGGHGPLRPGLRRVEHRRH